MQDSQYGKQYFPFNLRRGVCLFYVCLFVCTVFIGRQLQILRTCFFNRNNFCCLQYIFCHCADKNQISFCHGATAPSGPGPPHYRRCTITFICTTFGSTPLHEWSARRRELYLTKHIIHKRQTSTRPAGFEPTIPASERPQTHTLDLAATGIDKETDTWYNLLLLLCLRRSKQQGTISNS